MSDAVVNQRMTRRAMLRAGLAVGGALAASVLVSARTATAAGAPLQSRQTGWLRRWDGVTLTLSSHVGPATDAYKVIAKGFEMQTGATVKVIDESWTDLLAKHLAEAAAHTGTFDVLTWPYIWTGHYVEGDIVEDLNDWFSRTDLVDPEYGMDDFIPAIVEVYGRYRTGNFTKPDALWSVPYKFDIYLAMYRKDMFDGVGVSTPPATHDDLLAAAEKLASKYPDIKPLTFPLAVDDPMVATFLPILCSYGGKVPMPWFDENQYPIFHQQPGIDAARVLVKEVAYMPSDVLNMDYDKVNAQMQQGLTAYAWNWNAYLPAVLDQEKSKVADTVAFDLTPGGPAGRPQGLGGWQMGISKDSHNKEAAFQLLQYLTSQKQAAELALAGGSVARYSVAKDPQVIEKLPYYPLLLQAMEKVAVRGMDRSWAEVQRTIGVGLNKILAGADVEQALVETARQVYEQEQKAGYHPENTGPAPG